MTFAKGISDALAETIQDKVFLVDGPTGQVAVFEAGALLAAVRAFDVRQQQLWMESFVVAHVTATRQTVWWLADVQGWDFLLTQEPPADLAQAARGATVWKPHQPIHGEPYRGGTDGAGEARP